MTSKLRRRPLALRAGRAAGVRPSRAITIDLAAESLEPRTLLTGATAAASQALAAYGQIPISFEPNQGQTDPQVNFLSRGNGYTFFLEANQSVLELQPSGGTQGNVLQTELLGANPNAQPVALDPQASTSNYFIGNNPASWQTNVPNLGRVEYQGVYPGIDLTYYGTQGRIEYDFRVAPGADPGAIRLSFQGAQNLSIDGQGNLVVHMAGGDVVEHAPVLYQTSSGTQQPVSGSYVLLGGGQVGFHVSAYDASLPLVIDPVLSYSTFLGGSLGDKAFAVAADSAGNAYITGETGSTNFPTTPGAFDTTNHGSNTVTDVFVTKLSPTGQLVYSTYIGGTSDDHGTGIAIDSQGNAYICGWTQQSTDYPVTPGAFQPLYDHSQDGFVTKLNATGTALVYSTYLGGGSDDEPHAIAVDGQGFAYIVGDTFSTDFPTKNPIQGGVFNSFDDAFLTKLNQTGTALVYSTYIRGGSQDAGTGVAVDSAGEAVVVGTTSSLDFPTTANAFQKTRGGDPAQNVSNTFVTKINAAGTGYVYSTYLGGSIGNANDVSNGGPAVATDSAGSAYVTGDTFDPDFPVTIDAAQQVENQTDTFGLSDAFIAKFNTTGGIVYSTYLGGGGLNTTDGGRGIAVDAQGNAYVTGFTADTGVPFPTAFAFQATKPGNFDAFVTRVSADGTNFDYSSYLGGQTFDSGRGIALDGNGNAYIVGLTKSTTNGVVDNFPTLNAIKSTPPATFDTDGFVTRVNLLEPGAGTFYFPFATYETTEAGSFITIQVDRRGGDATAASVNFSTSNGTAHSGTNYTTQSGTLNFAVGEHEKTFTIPILNDQVNDNTPFLTFHLALSSPTAGAVLDATASTADVHIYDVQTTRTDNDLFDNALPLVGNATATGTNVNATANQGGDDMFDFPVTSSDVTAPKNGGGASVWWIWTPQSSGQTSIDTFGSDFNTLITVFSHGHMVENDDAPGVSDGTSKVTFQAHTGLVYRICVQGFDAGGGPATGNIALHINGVASGTLQFTQPSYLANETDASITIPITRTGGSTGAVSVLVSTSDGTATAGTDYTAVSQTVNWAAGDTSTKNVVIPILDDGAVDNLSQTFNVTLSNVAGGASIGSPSSSPVVILEPVVNNGSLQLSQSTFSVSETGGSIIVPVTRTGGSTGAVSVLVSTSNGTATAGSDYTTVSQTVNWADGDTATKNVTISILDDGAVDSTNQSFTVTLSGATGGATIGPPSNAVVTIVEPEVVAGTLQFSASAYNVGEAGHSVTITATRTGGSTGAVSVHYATSNGSGLAGTDYTANSGTLSWADGDRASKTFSIPILDDNLNGESPETVNITLSSPAGGAALGNPAAAVLTITEPPLTGTRGDYDADGKADLAIFRPQIGTFFVKQSTLGGEHVQFGALGDTPLQGDINGDGKTDFVLFRRATATFYVEFGGSGQTMKFPFGAPNLDIPVLGDYDGDGKTDFAVYRPTTGEWFVALAAGGHMHVSFGAPGIDRPEPADYNGDGKTDFAVYRPTTNQFFMMGIGKVTIGQAGDIAVPGAYDGGAAEPAVFRPSTDQWIIDGPGGVIRTVTFGQGNDVAVPNDYSGDGKTDLATFKFATGTWLIAGAGPATGFGAPITDFPVPRALDYITSTFGSVKSPASAPGTSAFDFGRQASAFAASTSASTTDAALVVLPGAGSSTSAATPTSTTGPIRAAVAAPSLLASRAAARPAVAVSPGQPQDESTALADDAFEAEGAAPADALASLARIRIKRLIEDA